MRRLLILLSLIFAIGKGSVCAETANWDIILFGDKVGHMSIQHETTADGTETFVLNSYTRAKILWINKEVTSHVEIVFKGGKMISSVYKEVENGEVKRWYNVTWNGSSYNADGYKGKKIITQVISCTVVAAYFKDLSKLTNVFDEAEAEFAPLQHTEPDVCEFKSGDRGKNVFHTLNGQVQNVEFHASIATVKMVKVK